MKTLEDRYLKVLENYDWRVSSYTDDGRVELQTYSPAGEDFYICVEVENFPEAVAEYAADFDPDEHIEMWLAARHNKVSGVPGTRELVHDAEDIDKMLQELAAALYRADEEPAPGDDDSPKRMSVDEFRQWIYDNYNVPGDNCTLAPGMLDGILEYAGRMTKEERNAFFRIVFPSLPGDVIRRVDY